MQVMDSTFKEKLARLVLIFSLSLFMTATVFLILRQEPFYTFYFIFAWWSYIALADSWLYLHGGKSVGINQINEFIFFLLPLSCLIWFIFEAFNLRLNNWYYIGAISSASLKWIGYFLSFATVLPGIFLTANLLDYAGIFPNKENLDPSIKPFGLTITVLIAASGALMLILPLLYPNYFFPFVWIGFIFLLDPINAAWGGRSLIQEWRQKKWNTTLQLLLAGLICGGLWELGNYWAGAKWIYTVPLPESFGGKTKIFEMPILGFFGFPPFAVECFVMTQFTYLLRDRLSPYAWKSVAMMGIIFMILVCWKIQQ